MHDTYLAITTLILNRLHDARTALARRVEAAHNDETGGVSLEVIVLAVLGVGLAVGVMTLITLKATSYLNNFKMP